MIFRGWVEDIKDIGKVKFIILHTPKEDYQVTCRKDLMENFEELEKLTLQSAIEVEGELLEKGISKKYKEILAKRIKIVSLAPNILPIDPSGKVNYSLDKKLDWRFLDFRNHKTLSIIKIQNTILRSFRDFFSKEGFIEIQPPIIISSASEGGADLFKINYFEKEAYLAQSPQLYKQMAAISLEKVFCVVPIFRAEKHNTLYHLNEVRSLDIEVAFANHEDVMRYLERFFVYTLERIQNENEKELKELNVKLNIPQLPLDRIKYEEAIQILNLNFGDEIKREHEKILCEKISEALFITNFPKEHRPFYTMLNDENKNITNSFDFLYRGLELASGAQRIHIPELLEMRLIENNLNPNNFKEYIEAFKYGAPPHAGWAIGLERFTMKVCNLENIREATMWPRDRFRLNP
ncbi:MAG: aspartate--tRNA(Asn) ligase [Candidatus Aenigmarchaeota archaeon]|nr:aspartate--tRNA(Asn) ligase [Candidatus Aenigmarchaeota archaeon]